MADAILKEAEQSLSCDPDKLPSAIERLLTIHPKSARILTLVKQTLKSRELDDAVLVKCTRIATEIYFSDADPRSAGEINAAKESNLLNCILGIVYSLVDKSVPPADAVVIFRCLNSGLPVPAKDSHSRVLHHISRDYVKPDCDSKDADVQELALWHLWYKVQCEASAQATVKDGATVRSANWKNFSYSVLKKWSSTIKSVDTKICSRFIAALIRFTSSEDTDVFRILRSLELNSPLNALLRPLSERLVLRGLEHARIEGLVPEYLTILNVISAHFLNVLEAERNRNNLWYIAKTIFAMLQCMVAEEKGSIDNVLLLARHVIYHRKALDVSELGKLCELIGELREVLPFSNEKHILWEKEQMAKLGISISAAIRDLQKSAHAVEIADTFMKIMRMRMAVAPESKSSLQMLRTATSFVEVGLYTQFHSGSEPIQVSPEGVFELLKVYGPDGVDHMLLVACVSFLNRRGTFLCDCIEETDPQMPKWLALELYALLRIGAAMEVISHVQSRLSKFAKTEHVPVIMAVVGLRAKAANKMDIGDELSLPKDNVLVESARRSILFGVAHMQLSRKIQKEHEQILSLLREKPSSGHEKYEQTDKADFITDLPVCLSALCCGNFIDLFRNMRWAFDNHKSLKGVPYWVLLSTFVLDDLRTAAGFYGINGDYTNQLRSLSCLHLLMTQSEAPETMIIDNKLRMVEALLYIGCTENARAIIEKLEPKIKALPMYSEDFFYLENKLERLRLCLLVEENGPEPPKDLSAFSNPVRSSILDKIQVYAMGRYFHGKAIHQWKLCTTGQLVATDGLESCCRNLQNCLQSLREKDLAMTTWEHFELAYTFLISNSLRADLAFDLGAMRDTLSFTNEGHYESQRSVSFYFLLRHMERLIRVALLFEISIDSKMSLVSDLVDPKRTEAPAIEAEEAPDAEESFDIRKADTIPYRTALFLKMRQHQMDTAKRRVPAKEFLKFHKRRTHSRECRCPMCSSIAIEATLKRIDAVTSSITKEKFVPLGSSVFDRLASGLRSVARVNGYDVPNETHCEGIVQDVRITHAFHLAQGYAAEGEFSEALEVLDNLREVELSHEYALEWCLRKFEYTYQIDWQEALKILNVHSNTPVETSTPPERPCETFKTPAMVRKREVKNVKARRIMRFPVTDSESGASSEEDAPEKKIPKKAESDIAADVIEKPKPKKKKNVETTKKPAAAPNAGDQDKPKFVPLDEFSGVTTRRKKKLLDLPRSESASKKITSVDDLFDDEAEMSFVETFARMNFRNRLKKPKPMSQCNAESEFQILLEAARKCEPLAKQSLVTDLFQILAFLSAHRNNRLEFAFYLERSIGISVHLAALNRGSRTADFFDEKIFATDYLNLLQPTTDFDPSWHERIWDWCDRDWLIVQVSTIMEGGSTPGLVVTRYECGHQPDIVHLSATHDAHFQGSLLKHYDDLQAMNSWTLEKCVKSSSHHYWKRRYEADELLHEFCVSLENSWMGCWKGMFRAEISGPEKRIVDDLLSKIIDFAKLRGFKPDVRMLSVGLQAIDVLKPEQLSTMLSKVLGAQYDDEVRQVQKFAASLICAEDLHELKKARRKPVILVLDKLLINLPIDSCPMFSEYPQTRMPSVPFTAAHALFLKRRNKKDPFALKDPKEGFYIVNPGKDLPATEERFIENLRCIVNLWEGLFREFLSREDFRKVLQSKSVYLYSGHGSGRQFVREYIETINVRAVILLFGCSSGRMRRLGTKMDTEGYAIRFLIGGSPAVVGNLWDVTDKDIDIFTCGVIRKWLYKLVALADNEPEPQLGAAVNKSRRECKLKSLVGAAPVVYGLPCISHTE